VALQIILVLGFGFPEITCGRDLGCDLSRPKTGGIDVGDRILSDALLFLARVEDRRAIACPDVIALAVSRGWIVNLKKEFQHPAVAYLRGVEDNFDRFGMCAVVAIRRVRHVAAGVANARRNHTIMAANEILHSPEAAAGEHCAFPCHSPILHLIEISPVALPFHVVAMDEAQRGGVDAVTQAATILGAIGEDMAEMAVAVGRADHAVRSVAQFLDVSRLDWLREARPTAA